MRRKVALSIGIALLATALYTPAQAATHVVTCVGAGQITFSPSLTKENKLVLEQALFGSNFDQARLTCTPSNGSFVPRAIVVGVGDYLACPFGGSGQGTALVVFPDGGFAYGDGKVTGTTAVQRITTKVSNPYAQAHKGTVYLQWVASTASTWAVTCPKSGIASLAARLVATYVGS